MNSELTTVPAMIFNKWIIPTVMLQVKQLTHTHSKILVHCFWNCPPYISADLKIRNIKQKIRRKIKTTTTTTNKQTNKTMEKEWKLNKREKQNFQSTMPELKDITSLGLLFLR